MALVLYRDAAGRALWSFTPDARLYFWLLAYCVGLLYDLHNNELEQQLQTYFAATRLPVMSLIRLLVSSGLVT